MPLVNNYMHSEYSTIYIIVMINMYTYITKELKYALTVKWGFNKCANNIWTFDTL